MHRLFFPALVVLSLISCTQQSENEVKDAHSHLGVISFSTSCNPESNALFTEGLLLLHSFEYEDARAEFVKARNADPDCAMAYWGEAMSYNHPLWAAQYSDEAHALLDTLGSTPEERVAKASSELEKDFITAVNILHGEGDKADRDKNYSNHMEMMYRKYPENHEVAAFYALSLLGSTAERNTENYEKGAIVVKSILKENPEHPGALHYLIHAYDDPGHAPMALNAANEYSKVAPDAGHALHMPSHIYVALGMWDEVVSSNIASWNADASRKEKLGLDNTALNYHALQWLMYGLLQQSRIDTARELLNDMEKYYNEKPTAGAIAYFTSMRAGFMSETGVWNNELRDISIQDSALNITIRATNKFAAGMGYYQDGDLDNMQATISSMKEMREDDYNKMMQRGTSMCSGVSWASQLPTQQDVNFAHIMELELRALLSDKSGDPEGAEKFLQEATKLEDETTYAYGPPVVVKPSHELFGDWLMSQGRYDEALNEYNLALQRAPKRLLSMKGKKDAEEKATSSI